MTEPTTSTTPAPTAPVSAEANVPVATEYDTLLRAAKEAATEYAKTAPAKAASSTSLSEEAPPAEAVEEGGTGEPTAPEAPAEDSNIVARLLKAKGREQAQKQRDEADTYLAKRRAEADAEAERRLRDADERARHLEREAEERVRRRIDELTTPEELLGREVDKKDPLYQLAKRFEADLKARDDRAEAMAAKLAELEARDVERDKGLPQARTTIAERNFLAKASEEKYPYARAYWDGDGELLQRAKAVLSDARAEAEKRGEADNFYCPDEDVLAFLNTEAKERLTRKRETLAKLLSPVESDSEPAKGDGRRGIGPQSRTLSAKAASERRATPKPSADMTEAEAEAAMRIAAGQAFRSK